MRGGGRILVQQRTMVPALFLGRVLYPTRKASPCGFNLLAIKLFILESFQEELYGIIKINILLFLQFSIVLYVISQ